MAEADTSSNDGSSKNEEADQRPFSDEENVLFGPTTRKAWSEWVKKASGKESSDDDNNNAG